MKKITIYGLPLNPYSKLEELQDSGGPEAPHQIAAPLSELKAATNENVAESLTALGFEVGWVGDDGEVREFNSERKAA